MQLLEQRKAIKENNYVTDSSVTMASLIARYFRDVAPLTLQPRTACIYRYATEKNIIPELGGILVSKLRAEQLQAFYAKKLAEGLSERYVLNLHNRIFSLLQVAKKWNLVPRNVAEDAIPPRPKDKKVTVLTVEQARIFLDGVRENRLYPLYACALVMGLREGELLALEWPDIDFIARRVKITKSQQYIPGEGISVKTPKTEQSVRDIPMPDIAYEALIEYRRNSMGTGRVFTTSKGTPFYPRNILKYFQRELERLGLPKIPFHNLRHSCASFHLAAGTSPKFVQELLGHTTVAFTLRKYSHLLPGVAEQAVAKLNDTFAGVP